MRVRMAIGSPPRRTSDNTFARTEYLPKTEQRQGESGGTSHRHYRVQVGASMRIGRKVVIWRMRTITFGIATIVLALCRAP